MSEEKKLGRTPRKDKNIHQRLNAIMAEVNYIKKDKKIKFTDSNYIYLNILLNDLLVIP